MQNRILFGITAVLIAAKALGQGPAVEWQSSYGGSANEGLWGVESSTDGGFVVAGWSLSNDGDVTGSHGLADGWLVKLNSAGELQWQMCLGGGAGDEINALQRTTDGGYIATGSSSSSIGDLEVNQGMNDIWVVKLNGTGDIEWQRTYGGVGNDIGYAIQESSEGGFVVAGSSSSALGYFNGNHGATDIAVIKLSSLGEVEWHVMLGGSGDEMGRSIVGTLDGGFIVCGFTYSDDGDVTGYHGQQDCWVVKLDFDGALLWQRSLGGSDHDQANAIKELPSGGYVGVGFTWSEDGDVTGNHGEKDFWIFELDVSGDLQWQSCYGGSLDDTGVDIELTPDGGYIMAGQTASLNGDVTESFGLGDAWLTKVDAIGNLEWQRSLGGSYGEGFVDVDLASTGGYIVSGFAQSEDYTRDFWVVKTSATDPTDVEHHAVERMVISPNPSAGIVRLQLQTRGLGTLSIVDALGRVVLKRTTSTGLVVLDLSNEPAGLYFATMQSAFGICAERFALE